MKNKIELTIFLIFISILLNAQTYTKESLPTRNNYLKWDKNIDMNNECGLIAWNGLELIAGNTATTVTILPDQTLAKNYVPLPRHNKKTTLCGSLFKDVFFADKADKYAVNVGLLEIVAKNDYDLNIPIEPNSNYSDFMKWGRTTAGGSSEEGYEGEIQFDSGNKITTARNDKEDKRDGFVDNFVAGVSLAFEGAKKVLSADDPVEAVQEAASLATDAYNEFDASTYIRDKFTFWKELKSNLSVCIYGSACTDGLNSKNTFVGDGTKTEIHPVEQLWYKDLNGNINFAFFRDYSNRFDKTEKNTNRTPWLNGERRKFAYPIKLNIEQGKFKDEFVVFINKGFSDLKLARSSWEEAMLLNVKVNDSTRTRLTVYLSKERADNKAYFSKSYIANSNSVMELPFYVGFEDVHVDSNDPSVIRAMLVISRNAYFPGIYKMMYGLKNISSEDPKWALKLAVKLKKEEDLRKAKAAAIKAAKKTIANSDILMVQSARISWTNKSLKICRIDIEPLLGQNLDGWNLISDENLKVMPPPKVEIQNPDRSKSNNLGFSATLKSTNYPLFVTLKKDEKIRKVYIKN